MPKEICDIIVKVDFETWGMRVATAPALDPAMSPSAFKAASIRRFLGKGHVNSL